MSTKNRREFIKLSALGSVALMTNAACSQADEGNLQEQPTAVPPVTNKPIVLSTWNHGEAANVEAWKVLREGGSALDAVEQGVRVTESDAENMSVGKGGLPDRDGNVTLDACTMDHKSNCGGVAFLQHIEHPISVARKVMEETEHVLIVGDGALAFALSKGFKKTDLLTEKAKKRWEEWKAESKYEPIINIENHDTIGMIALDEAGNLSGACTTSGLAWKMPGRVGDSPLIGAGLFVDNEVGAACATGVGEAVIKVAGSAMVVEMMRNGKSPQEACEAIVQRIIDKHDSIENMQVGFIALNKHGEYGCFSVYEGFSVAKTDKEKAEMVDAAFTRKWD